MTFILLILTAFFAWATYHSSTIAQQKSDELAKLYEELKKLQALNEEVTQAYRDALESLRECQQEDPCDPEYF